MDIEQFYSADERRRESEEIELGTEWHDSTGARYELSWVVATGELYMMLEPVVGGLYEDPFGDVFEVGHGARRTAQWRSSDGYPTAPGSTRCFRAGRTRSESRTASPGWRIA